MSETRPLLCPRDGHELKFTHERWWCSCGFVFTVAQWTAAPHTNMAEFLYDLARGRWPLVKPLEEEIQP